MRNIPQSQEIYRHFKGNLYQIITLAEHSETGESMVVYQAMYDVFKVYARPLSLFMEKTDMIKYPEAKQEYRFELQEVPIDDELYHKEPKEQEREEEGSDWEIGGVDPLVMKFLNANTYEQRLQILSGLRHRITHDMINTMAISMDLEIADGDPEVRYDELKHCLLTMRRFETRR